MTFVPRSSRLAVLFGLVALCACAKDRNALGHRCLPVNTVEAACSDGVDDDCDGFSDCLDTECGGVACGMGAGFTCRSGACLQPCDAETGCLPDLPEVIGVRPEVHDDTAVISFEPVAGARDYRIYPYPDPADVLVGENGELVVTDAIYRCAGDRPMRRREDDPVGHVGASFTFDANAGQGFARDGDESPLGYVYLTPRADRVAIHRMAEPNGGGAVEHAEWAAPPFADANSADYVAGDDERDRLLALGYRDDGIAFYAPLDGSRPVYRAQYEPSEWGELVSFFFTDGPEHDARATHTNVVEMGERFRVHAAADAESVPLHRVMYLHLNAHDVLAAGEARYERLLHQGNTPLPSLTWAGITEETTFVIEALDEGCPFPGGYIGAVAAPADIANHPTLTLDQARIVSGEVFVNGQHEPANRPRPIARAFVTIAPEAREPIAWSQTFDPDETLEPFTTMTENNGVFWYRNSSLALDFSGCSPNLSVGPLLGQLVIGFADYGSSCNLSAYPAVPATNIAAGSFVHMRMSTDIPSTGRRYPQMMLTTVLPMDPGPGHILADTILHGRLGPLPADLRGPDGMLGTADDGPPGTEVSIIVQPFGANHELQVQFCDRRGWGVGNQCPQANIYGFHVNAPSETWDEPWTPVPVLGERAGYDRPVRFDVYASTQRVYVLVDGEPAGCAVLPAGRMPAGPVTPAFRAVLYHSDIDETVTPATTSHRYLQNHSLMHTRRTFDDLAVEDGVAAPAWDESVLPCGTRWYGGT